MHNLVEDGQHYSTCLSMLCPSICPSDRPTDELSERTNNRPFVRPFIRPSIRPSIESITHTLTQSVSHTLTLNQAITGSLSCHLLAGAFTDSVRSAAELVIHVALLLPFSGSWPIGPRIAGAAQLAVERVNADQALLNGHVLQYTWADSGCSAKQALKAVGELFAQQLQTSPKTAVLGPGCSAGTPGYGGVHLGTLALIDIVFSLFLAIQWGFGMLCSM